MHWRMSMKKRIVCGALVLLGLVGSFLLAQDQVAVISPANPKIGDEVMITYNAVAKGATLRDVREMTAEVLLAKDGVNPQLLELVMKQSKDVWRASFRLTDEKSRLLLFRFASGEKKDDNGENIWETMVCGPDGKPLMGAHMMRYSLLRYGSFVDFKHAKDADAASAELVKEKELYPESYAPTFTRWSLMMREKPGDETKATIKDELVKEFAKGKTNEDALPQFASWFEQVGMKEKAEEIRKGVLEKSPKSKSAFNIRYSAATRDPDMAKRAEGIEKLLADYPQDEATRSNYEPMVVYFYSQAKQYDKAAAKLESMPKKDGDMYNSYLAWPLIEKGEQLEKAVAWAKQGVDLTRNPDPSTKPSYMSAAQWKKSNDMSLGMVLDTYGFGLMQLGKTKEAEAAMKEAVDLTKGEQADINQRLAECYVKNGNYEKAMALAADCIQKGKSNDKLVETFKTAYVKAKGSEKGFEETLAQAKESAKGDLKKDLVKGRVNKPAVDFSLKSIDGKMVKLSDLRGKVVVVDFWATWCGPCKASFPYLQKVYNKYKENPKVMILALDTWENVSGKEREDLVKKFMADNKYTFPVLYDEGFVEKYGVDGIPTKFIIDKKGMIQFKTIGFTGEKMVDEMIIQLDMLLDDNFYISMK
jgi:thiol-disulfide isomerase/thioredoxin